MDDLGMTGYDTYYGHGRINAAKTLSLAKPFLDTTPPSTNITNPKNGASISKSTSVTVSVSSSDNVKVTKTELYVNNTLLSSSNTSLLSFKWDTRKLARGSYTLQSRAIDSSNNNALSQPITVFK